MVWQKDFFIIANFRTLFSAFNRATLLVFSQCIDDEPAADVRNDVVAL